MTAFCWTKKRERAALLVASDERTDEEIAQECGIARRTLHAWKGHEEFQARVAQHVDAYRAAIRSRGIAIKEHRVAALQERWNGMRRVIRERGEAEEMQAVPGGVTGLLVRQVKLVKVYDAGPAPEEGQEEHGDLAPHFPPQMREVAEFALDTGILSELRAHEQQAAKELNQWVEHQDVTSLGKGLPFGAFADLPDEELDRRLAIAEGREAPAALPEEP